MDVLRHGEDIARRELCKTIRRLGPDVPPETVKALERLAVSISHKILHEPIVFLKRRSRENAGERFIDLIRRIFDLDREAVPEDAHGRGAPSADCACDEELSNKASTPCVLYLIEELTEGDMERIKARLTEKGFSGSLDDIYFIPFPMEMLNDEQTEHLPECGPYVLILETGPSFVKLELLIRGKGKLRCSCISYCTPEQRKQMIDFLDDFIRELDIPV